jgi:hypothetical protein
MTKQQMIETLKSQLPGFYSAEQVIEMLNKIEDGNTVSTLTPEQITEIADNVASSVVAEGIDLVEDYDLAMNYREVELDSLSLDEGRISREVERALKDWFENQD